MFGLEGILEMDQLTLSSIFGQEYVILLEQMLHALPAFVKGV